MKMKITIVTAAIALMFSIAQLWAIQGLQLSVQCTNVVLTWPSVDGNGDTFLIQRCSPLTPNAAWTVITNSYPADSGTNMTTFVDYGAISNVSCDGGGYAMAISGRTPRNGGNVAGLSQIANNYPMPQLPPLPPGFEYATNEAGATVLISNSTANANGLALGVSPQGLGAPMPFGASGGSTNTLPSQVAFYQVVKIGATIYGLTNNSTVSGLLTLSVEVAEPSGSLISLTLEDSESVISTSIHNAPFETPVPMMTLDTTQMSNGVHSIAAHAFWTDPGDGSEEDQLDYEATSPSIMITVSNEISFPNWMPQFGELGNSLLIRAQSAHTNANWFIDVYDSQYSYIGTFGGTTPDGNIEVVWNLVGPDGVTHNDPTFEFVVTTVYGDPVTTSVLVPPTYRQTDPWAGPGDWVVVNQQAWQNLVGADLLDIMTDTFVAGAQGFGLTVRPNIGQQTAYRIHFGTDEPEGDTDWSNFRSALYNNYSRNLFYLGHGTPNGIGYNLASTNRSISAIELGTVLKNFPAGSTNAHKFRFVCLDGCSTASGNLPEAFGIIHKEDISELDYLNASVRPSAFAGWSDEKAAGFVGSINTSHPLFFQYFLQEWLGAGVNQAFLNAARYPDVSLAGASNLKVFGDWDLRANSYNR